MATMDMEDFILSKSNFPFNITLNSLKFWKKHSSSITINEGEYCQKVTYLGNMLTAWAKGDPSVNRALDTLWNNHDNRKNHQNHTDIQMRLTICNSGLKAETKQYGLTEYWANRITYCCWKQKYPKIFCWVYRHIGRRGKPELRCHAVLCQKEDVAKRMARLLEERLAMALREFLREKLIRQRARMSLMEMPIRKQLLVKGMANFRPPIERSRSAPRLVSILEDAQQEEDEERELLKLFQKEEEEEEDYEDFAEMSSISIDDDDDNGSSGNSGNIRLRKCTKHHIDDDCDCNCDDDENDSAIDSESFKSDEIMYSTNG
nr:LOW QUALITY PROTEIN: protein FAM43A-like [Dermatophagoides farinae]